MNKKSFTLIELLVVIAIIGILSSLVIARFSDWGDNARIANTLQWSAGVHRTLGANLVGHWPLNGDANDISGYGNDGTMNNFDGDYWVDGVLGSESIALKFEVNDFIEVLHHPSIYLNNEFTISYWAKPLSDGLFKVITSNQSWGITDPGVRTNIHTDNKWGFLLSDDINYIGKTTVHSVSINEWQHIVLTYEKDNSRVTMYKNMIPDEDVFNKSVGVTNSLLIGKRVAGSNFNGFLSDVRIYNTALTAEEVGRIYAESKDRYLAEE